MKRLFWVAMGATIGGMAVRRVSKAAQQLTPGGIAERVGDGLTELASAVRDFAVQVRAAMSEREVELRRATGLDAAPDPSQAPER